MRKIIPLLLIVVLNTKANAQTPVIERPVVEVQPLMPVKTKDTTDFNKVFNLVQIDADYPGGDKAWNEYLQKNLNYKLGEKYIKIPKHEKSAKALVTVFVTVNKEGSSSDVVAEGINAHPKLIEEAIRVVKAVPTWNPAIHMGRKVAHRKRIIIKWQVGEE